MSLTQKQLLVCVQAVDMDDPLMGFFVTWLEEAAKQCSQITVLALRVGRYHLPSNVTVLPLRPANSHSKMLVIKTLLRESWFRRQAYDAVFVRGDPQYVLCAGWLWRILGKKIVFWYAHWKVSIWAVLAHIVTHVTTTSVQATFDHPWIAPVCIGQNVDHTRFSAPNLPQVRSVRCLAFGSVRPIKRIDVALKAFLQAQEIVPTTLTIIGPRTDVAYEFLLHTLAEGHATVSWGEAVAYDQVPQVLANYDVLINACPSLDKVILEAMMSGQVVISSTLGIKEWLPEHLHWLYAYSAEEIAHALRRVFRLTPEERWRLGLDLRVLAIQHHSLQGQITKLVHLL